MVCLWIVVPESLLNIGIPNSLLALFVPAMHAYALRGVDGVDCAGSHVPSTIIFLVPPPGDE